MLNDYKKVPAKGLKKGDTFQRWHSNGTSHFARAEVIEITGAMIKLKVFDTREETYSTEDFYAEIELTRAEFRAKYEKDAQKVVETLKENQLYDIEEYIGYHEMWNSWIRLDPWEFGRACREHGIEVVGWFFLDIPKDIGIGTELDIGIVAHDGDQKFWCHSSYEWLEDIFEEWEKAHNE